MRTQRTLELYC